MTSSRSSITAGLIVAIFALRAPCAAAGEAGPRMDLRDLSLGELLQLRVTSAGRKDEPRAGGAAAAHVITAEDIRRSAATSIPDLLRSVPGLHVAQLNASTWAVGSRGFADTYSDKLLVLVDGRSVYTPLFSGVRWDSVDIPLPDIERIEVIRGPGASLWGANAVNGVINIILKSSADMQGSVLRVRAATGDAGGMLARHGFRIGDRTTATIVARSVRQGSNDDAGGGDAHDGWNRHELGFRLDSKLSDRQTLVINAGAHRGTAGMLNSVHPTGAGSTWVPARRAISGEHVQARWVREIEPGRRLSIQGWVGRSVRDEPDFEDRLTTFDVEIDKRLPLGSRHDLTWGVGLRQSRDEVRGTAAKSFTHGTHVFRLASAFVHDEIRIAEATRLTLGVRVQRDERGHVAVQPTVRIAWQATPGLLAWGAASRALRTSNRVDLDARLTASTGWSEEAGLPLLVRVEGRDETSPERLSSVEAGIRWNPNEHFALDVSAFASEYAGLRTFEAEAPRVEILDGAPVLVVPARVDDLLGATTRGLEVGLSYSPVRRLRLRLAATALDIAFRHEPGSTDVYGDWQGDRGNTPRRRAFLSAQVDLPKDWELDVSVEHASGWVARGMRDTTRFGVRVGWRPSDRFELGFSVRDLFGARTREHSGDTPFTNVEPMPRSAGVSLTWSF